MTSRGNHQNLSSTIASVLQWGSNYTVLGQSSIVAGYVPVVQSNGTLVLQPPSAFTLGWPDVLADNPNSGANNPSIDSGQALLFAGSLGVRIQGAINAGSNAVVIGTNAIANVTGVSVGFQAVTSSTTNAAVAVGANSLVASSATDGVSIGSGATCNSPRDIVIGPGAVSTGTGGSGRVVIGYLANGGAASVTNTVNIGTSTITANSGCISIGNTASSSNSNSISVGSGSISVGPRDLAIGSSASTVGTAGSAQERISIGANSVSGAGSINYSIALGSSASSVGLGSISVGRLASTLQSNDISVGISSQCVGAGSAHSRIAIGASATAGSLNSIYSTAIGSQANCSSSGGIAFGRLSSCTHQNSSCFGISSTSTANNQIMLGNNATGGCVQVYSNVGTTGLMESAGYIVSFNQVRGSLSPSATQNIASGSGATPITMATVNFASDYGSPAITSVASRLQTRANRSMSGYFSLQFLFTAPPVASGYLTVRIMKNTNGASSVVSPGQVYVVAGLTGTYSINIPFLDFNAVVPSPNTDYFCDVDNPVGFGVILQVQTSSHFVGNMIN